MPNQQNLSQVGANKKTKTLFWVDVANNYIKSIANNKTNA